jgi:hypothetical protein
MSSTSTSGDQRRWLVVISFTTNRHQGPILGTVAGIGLTERGRTLLLAD